jgi:hypothetical protein
LESIAFYLAFGREGRLQRMDFLLGGNKALEVMLKDRQEFLAVGELALFLATWFATVWAAVDHFRQSSEYVRGNSLAATSHLERPLEK